MHRSVQPSESAPPPGAAPSLDLRFRELPAPLVLIGMHRSGTSLAAGMLQALGVFMGPGSPEAAGAASELQRQSGYAEAEAFRLLNEELLALAGGSWNRPEPFLARRDDPDFAAACLRAIARASRRSLYSDFLSFLTPDYRGVWGWKDPRTTLTLPFWLSYFPGARVLHIRRRPEAVVASLQSRARAWASAPAPEQSTASRAAWALRHPVAAAVALGRRARFLAAPAAEPDPCMDPDHCLHLHRTYVAEAERYRHLGPSYAELQYEKILQDPVAAAATMAEFCGLAPDEERLARAESRVSGPQRPEG